MLVWKMVVCYQVNVVCLMLVWKMVYQVNALTHARKW